MTIEYNGKVEIHGKVKVSTRCLSGVGAKVISKRRIGVGATVDTGSVSARNVPLVFGDPAKKRI